MEAIDDYPLSMVLKSLIAQVNQSGKPGKISWDKLSQISMRIGGPQVDFDSFEKLSSEDPSLQTLVVDYNKKGVILATDDNVSERESETPEPSAPPNKGDAAAIRASNKDMKTRLK